MPFGAQKPAVFAGVLNGRADGKRTPTVAVGGIDRSGRSAMGRAATVIAHLLVRVTSDTEYPAVAHAPAKGVIGMKLTARLVVGVLILEVVVVHQAHIGIETVRVHVGHGIHRLYGVVVIAEVNQVVLVVLAACWQYEIDTCGSVKLVAVREPDHRAQMCVAYASFMVVRTVLDVQPHVIER